MYNVQAKQGPTYVLRPALGTDLLDELQAFVCKHGINLAWISGVGAVSRAGLRFYDQATKTWHDIDLDQNMEVAGMQGNVSLLNGEPIVHIHITLADEDGRYYGGHVATNTIVFNMEIFMTSLIGPPVTRKLDVDTGLTIWS